MFTRLRINYSYIVDIFQLLSKNDKTKIFYLGIFQFVISILDLLGLLLIGVVSSIAVSVISLVPIASSLNFILEAPILKNLPLTKVVVILSLISAILLILKTLTSAFIMRKITGFLSLRESQISSLYISKVANTSPKWQLDKSPQYISGVAIEGVNSAITLTLGQLVNLMVESLSIVLLFIGISTLDPTITIPSFIFFVTTGWLSVKFLSGKTKEAGREQFFLGISSNELVKNIVVNSRDLYLSNKRTEATTRYSNQRHKNFEAVRAKAMISLIPKYVSELTLIVGGLLIAGLQFMIKDAREAVTGLVVFVALSSRLLPALLRIQSDVLQIRGSSEAAKNFLAEFQMANMSSSNDGSRVIADPTGEPNPTRMTPRICLRDVTVKYSNDSNFSIEGLTIDVEPGEFLAIAGPSGSGKTTLVDVMLGIISPISGSILISGLPPSLAVKQWPNAIRYVPQDIQLIPGTILENVMWPDIETSFTKSELTELFDTVELSQWLGTLDKGWNSEINNLGTNLSGGQKQRIGLARALYSSPQILILDESTSALDSKTERDIVENILVKMDGLTRIVIAHRVSTIKEADRIIYLSAGKILAEGDYTEVGTAISYFDVQNE